MSELPEVERAVVYTPQPGDRVIIEVAQFSPDQAARLKEVAEQVFGVDVQIVVLSDAHFAGVVRPDPKDP